jgi:transcriptional regulator with XRE-family HTH domain
MLTTYLNTLKTQGNFTVETIANLSGIPEGTVKNILSGKTEDPRFETVSAIVKAMGGSLDAVYSVAKKEDIEANSVITLKESYEQRLKETNEHYQQRISDMKEHYEKRISEKNEHIATIQLDKRWFRIATCICAFALVVLFIVEILTPGMGWFRY